MIPILNRTHQTRWILPLCLLAFSPISAQTSTSYYRPGVTTEGAVYFLPKTAVKVTVQVEKATYSNKDINYSSQEQSQVEKATYSNKEITYPEYSAPEQSELEKATYSNKEINY